MKACYKSVLPIRWEPLDIKIPLYLNIAHCTQKEKKERQNHRNRNLRHRKLRKVQTVLHSCSSATISWVKDRKIHHGP